MLEIVLDTDKVFHGIHVGFPINIVNAVQEMGRYGWNPDISLCSVEEYNHVNLEDFIYLIHIQNQRQRVIKEIFPWELTRIHSMDHPIPIKEVCARRS